MRDVWVVGIDIETDNSRRDCLCVRATFGYHHASARFCALDACHFPQCCRLAGSVSRAVIMTSPSPQPKATVTAAGRDESRSTSWQQRDRRMSSRRTIPVGGGRVLPPYGLDCVARTAGCLWSAPGDSSTANASSQARPSSCTGNILRSFGGSPNRMQPMPTPRA